MPVVDDMAETLQEPLPFGAFAPQERDLFGVFAHPNQVEAKIGLEALLPEIKIDQRRSDPLRQRRSENCINQRTPHQVTRDSELLAGNVQRRLA